MMEWVNRVGIVLEFLSFWFAAPEILGEERLRALERGIERGIAQLPTMVGALMVMAAMAMVIVLYRQQWRTRGESFDISRAVGLALVTAFAMLLWWWLSKKLMESLSADWQTWTVLVITAVASVIVLAVLAVIAFLILVGRWVGDATVSQKVVGFVLALVMWVALAVACLASALLLQDRLALCQP